jgi:hypothetical protein
VKDRHVVSLISSHLEQPWPFITALVNKKNPLVSDINLILPSFIVIFLCLTRVYGMDKTTVKPEATTEDTSTRLLTLPVAEKCAESECN